MPDEPTTNVEEPAFTWEASEYVHHDKGLIWNLVLAGAVIILVGLSLWLKYWLSAGVFLAMGAAVYTYAHKPPRTLVYELTSQGVTIDGRFLAFTEFRSFGVLPDIEWHSIDLEPAKRFNLRYTLLFEDDDFEEIVGHLEQHLSRIDRRPDIVDRVTRLLRF